MKIADLIPLIPVEEREGLEAFGSIGFNGIAADSRDVGKDFVFFALRGSQSDGHDYLADALDRGACLIIGEQENLGLSVAVPYVPAKNARRLLGFFASIVCGQPSNDLRVIGITGTSGKTTISYLIESIFRAEQGGSHSVGVIGTVNDRCGEKVFSSAHTTPGSLQLQKTILEMKKLGCETLVMEVSSHALDQSRVAGVAFDAVVFSNLTLEHLDYHGNMENYYQSKRVLFTTLVKDSQGQGKTPVAIINIRDPYGVRLSKEVLAETIGEFSCVSEIEGLKCRADGITGEIEGVRIHSDLVGDFNRENIALAVATTRALDVGDRAITEGVRGLSLVPGRMECVYARGPRVFVDYAHKPDALEKVLRHASQMVEQGRLITVFGCGGDRDREKRPQMGAIAEKYSDFLVVTSDNPRSEDPLAIMEEIVAGITDPSRVRLEADRKKGIQLAIQEAHSQDLVLIAGKGHEDYQLIQNKRIHFDDRETARQAIQTLKG